MLFIALPPRTAYIESASDLIVDVGASLTGIDFNSWLWRGRRGVIDLRGSQQLGRRGWWDDSPCTPVEFGMRSVGFSSTNDQLDQMPNECDSEIPPTKRAIDAARDALSKAFNVSPFPRGHVTDDDNGGICIAWTKGDAAVHLVINATDPSKDHIFHDDGKSFGTNIPVSGPLLALWIRRLILT